MWPKFLIQTTALFFLLFDVGAALDVTWVKANQQSVGIACKAAVSGTALYCSKDSTKVYTCQCSDVVGMGAYAYCGYTETEGNEGSRKRFQDYFMSQCALHSTQIGRLIGDRTGRIAMFTINLTFLFAGRNNFMLWCTGWNFQSFITYHKWVSRVTLVTVFVHAIAFYISSVTAGNIGTRAGRSYYRWGSVATVAGALIVLQAVYPLRKRFYEIFLYVHITMAVLFLVGTWLHLVYFDLQQYVFASVGLWSLDRLLRIIRIAGFGGYKKANITVVNDEFLVIMVKSYNSKAFKPQPGNFVFAYFGLKNCFWQSHPFTVVSCDPTNGVKIMAKIKKGCTNKVYKHIVSSSTSCCEVAVALEGPYGVSKERLVSRDQNILMYSTNTGVSGPYYYLESMIKKGTAQGKNIKFYWSIRNWSTLEMFSDELKLLSEQDSIDVFVYISQYDSDRYSESFSSSESELAVSEKKNKKSDFSKNNASEKIVDKSFSTSVPCFKNFEALLPLVHFKPGRMSVDATVSADISACLDNTNTTVMTCGHPEMCDDIRETVLQSVMQEKSKNIHLIDELQLW
ncbi:hypothetical protein ACO0QE_000060 [Hanseniaspora vineae]